MKLKQEATANTIPTPCLTEANIESLVKIQAFYRGYRARSQYIKLKEKEVIAYLLFRKSIGIILKKMIVN